MTPHIGWIDVAVGVLPVNSGSAISDITGKTPTTAQEESGTYDEPEVIPAAVVVDFVNADGV